MSAMKKGNRGIGSAVGSQAQKITSDRAVIERGMEVEVRRYGWREQEGNNEARTRRFLELKVKARGGQWTLLMLWKW